MDDGWARRGRRRNWIILGLVAIALPILVYCGLLLAISRGLSGSY